MNMMMTLTMTAATIIAEPAQVARAQAAPAQGGAVHPHPAGNDAAKSQACEIKQGSMIRRQMGGSASNAHYGDVAH